MVRDAFLSGGHEALSCDLLPSERPGPHYVGDVRDLLGEGWDMLVAFPPCTHLCRLAQCNRGLDPAKVQAAAEFVYLLWNAPIARVAIENPVGQLNKLWQLPSQMIQPWQFGHPYTKKTCLWLRGLPPLLYTQVVTPTAKWVRANPHGKTRREGVKSSAKERAKTFPGVAAAMAQQWGEWALVGAEK